MFVLVCVGSRPLGTVCTSISFVIVSFVRRCTINAAVVRDDVVIVVVDVIVVAVIRFVQAAATR